MSRDELLALAERVEKAVGAETGRFLTKAFYRINGSTFDARNMTESDLREWMDKERRFFRLLEVGAYLDAALTLVPERWTYSAYQGPSGQPHKWALRTIRDGDQRYTEVEAKAHTPALALTTAALRALAQTQPDNSND